MKTSIFTLIILLCLNSNYSKAQGILDRTLKKVEQKINDKIDEKTDKAVDKVFDETEKSISSGKNEKDTAKNQGDNANNYNFLSALSGEKPENLPDKYEFDIMFKYKATENDKPIKEMNDVEYRSSSNSDVLFIKVNEDGVVIMDLSNLITLTITNASGQSMCFAMPLDTTGQNFDNDKNIEITKTGNTKKILGYTCHEYKVKSDEGNGTAWLTKDIEAKGFFGLNSLNEMSDFSAEGFPMEMTFNNTEKNQKMHIVVTELDTKHKSTIKTDKLNFIRTK